MKKITVSDLRAQMERLEELGMGNWELVFMDEDGFTYEVEEGIHDTAKNKNIVILG